MKRWFLILLLIAPALALPGPSIIPVQVVNSSAPNKRIQILNEEKPGTAVDIESSLVPGKFNIVVFFADW